MKGPKVYIIGSLANPRVPEVAAELRRFEYNAFDEWYSAGRDADRSWQEHQQSIGRSYREALASAAAQNVFQFDKKHIDESAAVVMVGVGGRSAHLELGYAVGQRKPGFMLIEGDVPKWDVMALFATGICTSIDELVEALDANVAWKTAA